MLDQKQGSDDDSDFSEDPDEEEQKIPDNPLSRRQSLLAEQASMP